MDLRYWPARTCLPSSCISQRNGCWGRKSAARTCLPALASPKGTVADDEGTRNPLMSKSPTMPSAFAPPPSPPAETPSSAPFAGEAAKERPSYWRRRTAPLDETRPPVPPAAPGDPGGLDGGPVPGAANFSIGDDDEQASFDSRVVLPGRPPFDSASSDTR